MPNEMVALKERFILTDLDRAPFQGLSSSHPVTQGFTLGYDSVAPPGLRLLAWLMRASPHSSLAPTRSASFPVQDRNDIREEWIAFASIASWTPCRDEPVHRREG